MKSIQKILAISLLSITVLFVFSPVVLAQPTVETDHGLIGCKNDCELIDLVYVLVRIINYLFALSSFVCMIFIVWGGWGMITSGGNEEKISAGKKTLSAAIIGFFLVLAAWILIDAIVAILAGSAFTGLNFFFGFLPDPVSR